MSIPVTAASEPFTPACMAEIEGAPTFRFRHATVMDKHLYANMMLTEGLVFHSRQQVRDAIVNELRTEFHSEGMESNITKLEAYWAAIEEHDQALNAHDQVVAEIKSRHEGDGEPELPPEPVLDFPKDQVEQLDEMVTQVREESPRIRKLLAQNHWYLVNAPRLMLRMFLTGTSLPVRLRKNGGVLSDEATENVLEALIAEAKRLDVSPELAVAELQRKASSCFELSGEEEKNSSSPRSGISNPKQSASTQSNGTEVEATSSPSSDPATSEEDHGLNSSASDSPALV